MFKWLSRLFHGKPEITQAPTTRGKRYSRLSATSIPDELAAPYKLEPTAEDALVRHIQETTFGPTPPPAKND